MRTRRAATGGFTLIELLVVIAIIAVLAAIMFPAIMAARRNAQRNSCAANLGEIAAGLRMYHLDTGAYPPALYGFVNVGAPSGPKAAVYGLYPQWVRSATSFVCPDNPLVTGSAMDSVRLLTLAGAPNTPMLAPVYKPALDLQSKPWTDANSDGKDAAYPNGIQFARADSYDMSYVGPNATIPERHYQRQWLPMVNLSQVNPAASSYFLPDFATPEQKMEAYARQLVFKFPDDSSVVTVCTYHRDYPTGWTPGGATLFPPESTDIVLYLDGHTAFKRSREVGRYVNIGGPKWAGWQIGGR